MPDRNYKLSTYVRRFESLSMVELEAYLRFAKEEKASEERWYDGMKDDLKEGRHAHPEDFICGYDMADCYESVIEIIHERMDFMFRSVFEISEIRGLIHKDSYCYRRLMPSFSLLYSLINPSFLKSYFHC